MRYLVNKCFVAIFFIATSASAAEAQLSECAVLPRDATGRLTYKKLQMAIAADINNIGTGEPEASHYMQRLDSWLNAMMNLDCVTDDWRLSAATAALDGFDQGFAIQPDWSKSLRNVEVFKKKSGNSPISMALEAEYWIQYAWDARGTGFSSSVSGDGWKLYRERMQRAEKLLLDNKARASTVPLWYQQMIVVNTALGRPKKTRDEIFTEGASRFKKYYGLYRMMRFYLDPRWGGSFEAVDNMIKWSANNTKEIWGDRIYAQLYSGVRGGMLPGQSFFKDTLVDWERFRKAMLKTSDEYPLAYETHNQFAAIACEKGDRNSYLMMRKRIGKNIINESWGEKTPLELCDAKFDFKN